jgi:hypothetical protein
MARIDTSCVDKACGCAQEAENRVVTPGLSIINRPTIDKNRDLLRPCRVRYNHGVMAQSMRFNNTHARSASDQCAW